MGERVVIVRWIGAYGYADPYASFHYEARGCRGGRPRAAALQDADRLQPVGDARVGILLDPRRTRILAAHAGDAWTVYQRAGRRWALRATRSWSYGRGLEGLERAARDLGDRAYSEVVVRRMAPAAVLAVPGAEETARGLAAAIQAEVGRQVPVIVGQPADWLAHPAVAGASVRLGPGRDAGGKAPRLSRGPASAGAGESRRPRGRRYRARAVLIARGRDGSPLGARVELAPGFELMFRLEPGADVVAVLGHHLVNLHFGAYGTVVFSDWIASRTSPRGPWQAECGQVARVARWALRAALVAVLGSAERARSVLARARNRGSTEELVAVAAVWAAATLHAWAAHPETRPDRRAIEDAGRARGVGENGLDWALVARVAARLPAVGQAQFYEVAI